MQTIYEEQGDVTPEEEQVLSFLRGNGDDAVMEELARRKLTHEEMMSLEGPISKMEIKEELFHHMKPASTPGQACFMVRWIKHFWPDLEDLCHCSLNGCYEEMELTSLLKTAIMKILRKGEKCPLETGNYRPSPCSASFTKFDQDALQED